MSWQLGNRRIQAILALLASVALLGLTACGSVEPGPASQPATVSTTAGCTAPTNATAADPVLASYIDSLLAEVTTTWQCDILLSARASGQISEADWKQANDAYLSCMNDHGFPRETVIYEGAAVVTEWTLPDAEFSQELVDRHHAASWDCTLAHNGLINSLYRQIYGDSDQRDATSYLHSVFDCLRQADLIADSISFEAFAADPNAFVDQTNPQQRSCWR